MMSFHPCVEICLDELDFGTCHLHTSCTHVLPHLTSLCATAYQPWPCFPCLFMIVVLNLPSVPFQTPNSPNLPVQPSFPQSTHTISKPALQPHNKNKATDPLQFQVLSLSGTTSTPSRTNARSQLSSTCRIRRRNTLDLDPIRAHP